MNNNELKTINEQEIDYDELILLKNLTIKERKRIQNYITKKQLKSIKTPKGVAVSIPELEYALAHKRKQGAMPKVSTYYSINTSQPSKLNAYFVRVVDMNDYNAKMCKRSNAQAPLKKYIDQNGYLCINLRDYIMPQVKIIAKKLECKNNDVTRALAKLIYSLYLQRCRKIKKNRKTTKGDND